MMLDRYARSVIVRTRWFELQCCKYSFLEPSLQPTGRGPVERYGLAVH